MTLSDKILAYRDPRSRRMKLCGEDVLVVPPPVGAMPKLLGEIREVVDVGDVELLRMANDHPLLIAGCSKVVLLYCVREVADPSRHVFTPPTGRAERAMFMQQLDDLPQEDVLPIVIAAFDLMALSPDAVEREVKNS